VTSSPGGAGLPRLLVVPAEAVSDTAAEVIATTLAEAVAARGVAHWATTGGSAAPGIYRGLLAPSRLARVPWDRVHTWWGDDRYVPFDHPLSNVQAFDGDLVGVGEDDGGPTGAPIPAANIHPIPSPHAIAAGTGPEGAAAAYAEELRALVPLDDAGTPVLDLVVLGVGPDGHVLSVFPGSAVWDVADITAAVPAPTHVEPHVERVTVHPRLLAAARAVLVVSAGASKAANLGRAWIGDDTRELPVRAARLPTATWVLDEAAAAELPRG
jgi:6-phosphogluconolactonase